MTATAWVLLMGAWVIGLVSPGPDFIAVLRASVVAGRRAGSAVAFGIGTMLVFWVSLALTGISVVVTQHETAYRLLRSIGSIFLVVYGTWIVWSVWRARREMRTAGASRDRGAAAPRTVSRREGSSGWWWLGLLTNASNPKALAFFAALFASLLPREATVGERVVALVLMVGSAVAWFLLVARVASTGPLVAVYRRNGWLLDVVMGLFLVILGVVLFPR